MGTLADSLFNLLMGWVRALVNAIWALFTTDHTTLLEFLGKNWVLIVVVILAAGLAIDWLVWLIRWQPYHLWARRARRFCACPSRSRRKSAKARAERRRNAENARRLCAGGFRRAGRGRRRTVAAAPAAADGRAAGAGGHAARAERAGRGAGRIPRHEIRREGRRRHGRNPALFRRARGKGRARPRWSAAARRSTHGSSRCGRGAAEGRGRAAAHRAAKGL